QRTRALERFAPETALAALRSMGDAVVCTDAGLRVIFMNAVAEKLTGCNAAEAIGKPIGDALKLYDEDAGRPAANPAELCLQRGERYIRESGLLLTRAGSAYDIGLSAAPITMAGDEIGGCVILFN